ncbi:hypothetical protein MRX96_051480 [Rhipicephalus microplus]
MRSCRFEPVSLTHACSRSGVSRTHALEEDCEQHEFFGPRIAGQLARGFLSRDEHLSFTAPQARLGRKATCVFSEAACDLRIATVVCASCVRNTLLRVRSSAHSEPGPTWPSVPPRRLTWPAAEHEKESEALGFAPLVAMCVLLAEFAGRIA